MDGGSRADCPDRDGSPLFPPSEKHRNTITIVVILILYIMYLASVVMNMVMTVTTATARSSVGTSEGTKVQCYYTKSQKP